MKCPSCGEALHSRPTYKCPDYAVSVRPWPVNQMLIGANDNPIDSAEKLRVVEEIIKWMRMEADLRGWREKGLITALADFIEKKWGKK